MDASNDSFSYLSEPTSPSRYGKEALFFYSLPATPGFSPSPSQPATPCFFGNAYSYFDAFEFETSRRLGLNLIDSENRQDFEGRIDAEKHREKRLGFPLPEITFADELFSNGKILPLLPPLKLPPRLQRVNTCTGCKKSKTASSPRSPISTPKSKLSRNNQFDADFDPFAAALEKVRKEDGGKKLEDKSRRANGRQNIVPKSPQKLETGLNSPLLNHSPTGPRPKNLSRSGWAHLKGSAIARKLRMVKMESESKLGPLVEPAKKKKEMKKPTFFLRLKGMKSEFTKMTPAVWPRPKFVLCLGFRPMYND